MTEKVVNPIFQVFDPPLEDISVTDYELLEYRERNVNIVDLAQYNLINQDLD